MNDKPSFDPLLYLESEPTAQEKALYDKFILEYVKDFDAFAACIRVGFVPTFAMEYCKVFMTKPYILRKIIEHKTTPVEDTNEMAKDRALILATLREAMQTGNQQVRVAASAKLMALHGLDQTPDKTGDALEKIVDQFKQISKDLPD